MVAWEGGLSGIPEELSGYERGRHRRSAGDYQQTGLSEGFGWGYRVDFAGVVFAFCGSGLRYFGLL